MALSATFTANFSSFYDAVDKAQASLKSFGDGADKVGARLDRLTNQFSGRQVVQEAVTMAKAVEEIGGVSKLTEKEIARLGATTNEAVAKMRALGMDVPKNLQAIADQTKNANKQTNDWVGSLTKVAGAMGLAFSVQSITTFVAGVFDAASAVKDLSDQWGVSTKAVQQWTGAAAQSGVEAVTVGKSVQFLTEGLAEGSDAYQALLKNVGLSYAELRKMPLEDAYKAVVTAIGGIKDETLQLDVAQGLLGASSKKMVGAIRDGFLDAAEAQKIMADETIKRLEAAQAQWEKFKNAVITWTGEMLASTMTSIETSSKGWTRFFGDVMATMSSGISGHQAYMAALEQVDRQQAELNKTTAQATTTGAALTGGMRTTAQVTEDLRKKEEALKLAKQAATKAQEEQTKAWDAATRPILEHEKAVTALAKSLSGADLVGKAETYLAALAKSVPIQHMTREAQDAINKVMVDAIGVYTAAGQVAPQAMREIAKATEEAKAPTLGYLGAVRDLSGVLAVMPDISAGLKLAAPEKIPAGLFDGMAKNLTGSLSKSILGAIQGGGNVLSAAGSTIGNFLLDPKQSNIGKTITTAAGKLPGLMGSAISSALPVVGAFIGPAVGKLAEVITGFFGKKEHEKLRDSFVKTAGGMRELKAAAEGAGVSLDRLLNAKSSGKVNAAIKDIQDAITLQASAYDVAMEAAQRYGFTIAELGPTMKRQELDKQAQGLFKDWEVLNAAGIDTIAITDRMSKSVSEYVQNAIAMGLEIPDAMRPMLESFVKAGTLIDANGVKIEDLETAGVNFSLSMSEGFKTLIGQVEKLVAAIERSLIPAVEKVPEAGRGLKSIFGVALPQAPLPSYQEGTKGFKNFGAGTPVVLHGWEAVVPRDETGGAWATVPGASGGGAIAAAAPTIIINAQGALFDTPGDLQRLAARVEEALSARHGLTKKRRAA